MMKKVAIAGYSGHAYVVAESVLANGMELVGYLDVEEAHQNPFNIPYLGSENNEATLGLLKDKNITVALGIGNNQVRMKIFTALEFAGIELCSVIHPKAIVSSYSHIAEGCFVAAGAIIQAFAEVGKGSIINTGAIVEHECVIENFCHVAPGAILTGNTRLGQTGFFGAGATCKQGVVIGKNCVIGAGATVTSDVPDNETWVGVPAKKIK
jgi:acetyltransferase-like isoleucine patch superfamily enzyme